MQALPEGRAGFPACLDRMLASMGGSNTVNHATQTSTWTPGHCRHLPSDRLVDQLMTAFWKPWEALRNIIHFLVSIALLRPLRGLAKASYVWSRLR